MYEYSHDEFSGMQQTMNLLILRNNKLGIKDTSEGIGKTSNNCKVRPLLIKLMLTDIIFQKYVYFCATNNIGLRTNQEILGKSFFWKFKAFNQFRTSFRRRSGNCQTTHSILPLSPCPRATPRPQRPRSTPRPAAARRGRCFGLIILAELSEEINFEGFHNPIFEAHPAHQETWVKTLTVPQCCRHRFTVV